MFKEKLTAIRDHVLYGLFIGILVPLLPGVPVWIAMQKIEALREADLLLIGCVALNAWLMNLFFKWQKDRLARGILSATFLWAFLFLFYKEFKHLLLK